MSSFFQGLTLVAIAAVAVVLILGIVNMMRGNASNRSQLFMRWRVILQFVAIIVMMTALYFSTR
jgi:di/tricarboxylate transporter